MKRPLGKLVRLLLCRHFEEPETFSSRLGSGSGCSASDRLARPLGSDGSLNPSVTPRHLFLDGMNMSMHNFRSEAGVTHLPPSNRQGKKSKLGVSRHDHSSRDNQDKPEMMLLRAGSGSLGPAVMRSSAGCAYRRQKCVRAGVQWVYIWQVLCGHWSSPRAYSPKSLAILRLISSSHAAI